MKPIEFPEQTVVFAKDQPQYRPLPAYQFKEHPMRGHVACCWKLDWKERVKLFFTGKIWHQMWTFGQPLQPQRLDVDKPNMPLDGPLGR